LEIDPHLAGVHFELGEAILQSSSHNPQAQADAEKEFENAAKLEGDSASIECQLGRIALLRLEAEKAYTHYQRAFAMSPGDSEAQLGLGAVLLTLQKPREAVKYLRMAVQSDPLNSEAHYRLATAYGRLYLTVQAQKEMRIFNDLKQTMDQVRQLYRQMNRQPQELPGSPR
jgi:predicted Zn-dependent protease